MDKKSIDFKIIDIKDMNQRFSVTIEFINPVNNVKDKKIFSFLYEDQIGDIFIDKIKKFLDDEFNISVKVSIDRFVGKTFTHEFRR